MTEHKRPGPRTKAEKDKKTYKRLSITLPYSLWETIDAMRKPGESTSALIRRLITNLKEL